MRGFLLPFYDPFVIHLFQVEDGKLFYERRWFRRGQAVQVEAKSGEKYPAMITAIGECRFFNMFLGVCNLIFLKSMFFSFS